jgi:hypothetical protein
VTTLLSVVLTVLYAVVIFGLQVTSWNRTGVWETYRLASAVRSLKSDDGITYTTASSDKFQTELTSTQEMIEWLLGTPTIAILLIVVALHFVFYFHLVVVEKQEQNPIGHD